MKNFILAICALLSLTCSAFSEDNEKTIIGVQDDGRVVVPTNQVLSPYGDHIILSGRANDVAVSPDGQRIAILGAKSFLLYDVASDRIRYSTAYSKPSSDSGGSYKGIAFTPDGSGVLCSNIGGSLDLFLLPKGEERLKRGMLRLGEPDKPLVPAGFQIADDGSMAWVALCIANELAQVDLNTGKILKRIPVGTMPFDVQVRGSIAYVSNFGGGIPEANDTKGPGGDELPPIKVDPTRFIASEGSVSVVDLESGKETRQVVVGLHPSGMALSKSGQLLFVANANSDTVSVIDTEKLEVVETISTKPDADLLFGSSPNDLVLTQDETQLLVSNGTNNALCVIQLGKESVSKQADQTPDTSTVLGFLPTGWYPAGLALSGDGKSVYVANIKGIGSRKEDLVEQVEGSGILGGREVLRPNSPNVKEGYNTHEQTGSLSIIQVPDLRVLKEQTQVMIQNNRQTESISALAPPRPEAKPKPVPERHGEPSVFEHVVYIIKENRTYDQVFGDMPEGNGDPSLVHYGEEVTPNCHKLAREFVLLDNFYCSGILSADGHHWTTKAFATSYIEKAFGGFPRSYPYDGGDALSYASSGFLWDNCFAHGKTFRTYGEFVTATIRWKDPARQAQGNPKFIDCYRDFLDKKGEVEIIGKASIESLIPHTCTQTIGFPSIVPDIYRADVFIRELRQFEEKGGFPNLSMILIPNDHTAGTRPNMPKPRSAVADNDLALGQIIDAISHSKFWDKTCVMVVQDDPQNGADHVDGHRTLALVVSPYTKRRQVISTNYNQTSMIRTIELMLGLPPMNQFDSSAIPMSNCFVDEPDATPYTFVPNKIPLDDLNPALSEITNPDQLHWAKVSLELPLDDIDEAPEDVFNRILWHDAKGYSTPYPEYLALRLEDED